MFADAIKALYNQPRIQLMDKYFGALLLNVFVTFYDIPKSW